MVPIFRQSLLEEFVVLHLFVHVKSDRNNQSINRPVDHGMKGVRISRRLFQKVPEIIGRRLQFPFTLHEDHLIVTIV